MKNISIAILFLVVALASCKKTPEVNLKYVDVERDLITVGMTTATVQCDYDYIATLKKAYFYYGEGANEVDMNTAEMRVVQNTLYVDLTGLRANATYSYFYEFHNGFNSMRTAMKTFKTEASPTSVIQPTVVTSSVTEITTNSAKGGGEVTNDGGAQVTERGICWSTYANPTLSDNHVAAGEGMGAFTALMNGLEANTTYHVRAYATNEAGTVYGLDREFVTDDGGGCDCGYVDLGLPSGTLWASCNLGADSPEVYGDFFAWGETEPKDYYGLNTYKWNYGSGEEWQLTKYCYDANYGYNGFTDNLDALESDDDAATILLGDGSCIPTIDDWEELFQKTTNIWTTYNGVEGRLFSSSNGNSVFLPAAGNRWLSEYTGSGTEGFYTSSSLSIETPPNPSNNRLFCFDSHECAFRVGSRCYGTSVRPVRKNDTPIPPGNAPEGAVNGLFTTNYNGDQVYFSHGNLQYQASTNTWRFAENQWDMLAKPEDMTSHHEAYGDVADMSTQYTSSSTAWIDMFGWGTSGWHDENDPYNVYYQPWSMSNQEVVPYCDYNIWGYGPSVNMPSPSLIGSSANYDWGVYNAISNGGNAAGLWRTLTLDEWEYVFHTRTTDSGIHFAMACVNGVNGVIILPDNWSNDYYSLNNADLEGSFGHNVIGLTVWNNAFQVNGAVFLPATGERSGPWVYSIGSRGKYWQVVHETGDWGHSIEKVVSFGFVNSGYLNVGGDFGWTYRCFGISVRLVQDAH